MSIPTISNTPTTTDNRTTARQTGTQPGVDNGTGNGVGNGNVGNSNVGNQGAAGSSQADAVSISSRAADLQSLETSIRQLPDTDASRVNALREQINAGEYVVDSQRVADKMLAFERSL